MVYSPKDGIPSQY